MTEFERELCGVVEAALNDATLATLAAGTVTLDSQFNNPPEWDSLSFVEVFLSVKAHFGLEVDDEDAVHFMSIKDMIGFVQAA